MSFMQFIGSLIAVIIVALIAARLFPTKSKLTKERVINNVIRYCPHVDFTSASPLVYLSENHATAVALFPDHGDGFAIASALGDRVVVREIPDTNMVTVTETENGLSFDLGDFTQPTIEMLLSADQRRSLISQLTSLQSKKPEPAHA